MKLTGYNADIDWSDELKDGAVKGVVTLPDGSKANIRREQNDAHTVYFLEGDNGDTEARFDSFDYLMQRGLGLTLNA